ncbi:hypothetical protein EDD15DRAFT_1686275 [Pisolithus albus]|nr:hypothetical protein EDD15DRAFT_1686275 [Pisolithus albus]
MFPPPFSYSLFCSAVAFRPFTRVEDLDEDRNFLFKFNPLHDMESLWWIATWPLYYHVDQKGGRPSSEQITQFHELFPRRPDSALRAVLLQRRLFRSGVHIDDAACLRPLFLFGILAWSKTRGARCIRTAWVMGCIGGNGKDSRISSLVLDHSDTYHPPYQSSQGPRLLACLARETNAKWKPMQEGDRRE